MCLWHGHYITQFNDFHCWERFGFFPGKKLDFSHFFSLPIFAFSKMRFLLLHLKSSSVFVGGFMSCCPCHLLAKIFILLLLPYMSILSSQILAVVFYDVPVTCKLFLVCGQTTALEIWMSPSTSVVSIIRLKDQCQFKSYADRAICFQYLKIRGLSLYSFYVKISLISFGLLCL